MVDTTVQKPDRSATPLVMLNVDYLRAAAMAASRDKTRMYLCSVSVEVLQLRTTYVGTNGHVLVAIEDEDHPLDAPCHPFKLLIPTQTIKLLKSLLLKKGKEAGLFSNHVMVQRLESGILQFTSIAGSAGTDAGLLQCQEPDAKYPRWQRVVPDLERLRKGTPAQMVSFNWGCCALVSEAFNEAGGRGQLAMNFGGETEPALFTEWDGRFTGVVMPMKYGSGSKATEGKKDDPFAGEDDEDDSASHPSDELAEKIGEAIDAGTFGPGTSVRVNGSQGDAQKTPEFEEKYDTAAALVRAQGKCSTSYLQREMRLGYNYAADLVDELEKRGVVSAPNHMGKREILA